MQIFINKYEKVSNQQLIKEGKKPVLGHFFRKKDGTGTTREAHDFRCPICGKWIAYNDNEIDKFIRKGMWDFRKDRLLYCGDSVCSDYYQYCQEDLKNRSKTLFENLKRKGLAA